MGMSQDRGIMIQETVNELAFRNHLRNLAEQREMRAARKKKEACTGGAAQTSRQMPSKNLIYYTTEKEECQDVKSNRPEHTVYGEIRQQERNGDLPVYLL